MVEDQWFIYALRCPLENQIRYIGGTFNLHQRIACHKSNSTHHRNEEKFLWIEHLSSLGLEPDHEVLETGTGDFAMAERKWIAHFRKIGTPLTNRNSGGTRSFKTKRRVESDNEKLKLINVMASSPMELHILLTLEGLFDENRWKLACS